MIKLHEHSQRAYDALKAMIAETGKAAVIHPTGTGKSFIGFRMTEEYPEARFLWLSPSEAIWRTQKQNVWKAYGYAPENVTFCTYVRIDYLTDAEIAEWKPDYIILDEFHRCGAREWGQGVRRILSMYPEAKLIGLSATNIRYLDNQRDMAIELFDGCVADEMMLSEAIGKGLLQAPKYVVAIYSYDMELRRIERRIAQGGLVAQRETEAYYEKLRRALEKAPSFAELFEKHMINSRGKYVVFCAGIDHARQMAARAQEDFGRVDPEPRVYQMHEGSAGAKKAFEAFKADESNHLKLLYCVDMLNEGVHVDDLAGVILFRPTISPIIYKQQIGRAMSVGNGRTPVIFDIVNNFDALSTSAAMGYEIRQIAESILRERRSDDIARESFEIIDELRDCREILQQIDSVLANTWDVMYAAAERYYHATGNLDVPKRYRTEEGLPLGQWILTQRRVYRGTCNGTMSPDRLEKLNRIGMEWEENATRLWEDGYRHAEEYYREHGDLDMIASYQSPDGYRLGSWISNQRGKRKGRNGRQLTEEQTARLEKLGMIWSQVDRAFEQGYAAAAEYRKAHGDLWVPAGYVDEHGFRLGSWLLSKRMAHEHKGGARLTEEQAARLEKLGITWGNRHDLSWEENYAAVADYIREHGDLKVRYDYRKEGKCLYRWLSNQRDLIMKEKMSEERRDRLEKLGAPWQEWMKEHGG